MMELINEVTLTPKMEEMGFNVYERYFGNSHPNSRFLMRLACTLYRGVIKILMQQRFLAKSF